MKGPISSLLAMLALSSLMGGERRSPKEQYEQARVKAREGNINFLMGAWMDLLGDQAFEPVTVAQIVDAFFNHENSSTEEMDRMDPATREIANAEIASEFQACVSHWVEHGTLHSLGNDTYLMTEYGKGFIKGFHTGAKCDGKIALQIIKQLTDEQIETLGEDINAKMEADPDACPGCGGHHEDNPLDEIERMFSRGRKPRTEDEIKDLIAKLMRGR